MLYERLLFIFNHFQELFKKILTLENSQKDINNNLIVLLIIKKAIKKFLIEAFSYLVPHPPEEHPNPLPVLPYPPLLS